MSTPEPAFRLTLEQARRVWLAAQGIAAPAGVEELVPAVERSGFLRTLGGVDVYLAARARVAGLGRVDVDRAVAAGELKVVPAARGCIYLVPRRFVPLALRVAELLSRSRAEREQEKAGIRPGELEEVGEAVLAALEEHGPLSPNDLRKALPEGTARSLGEAGKKVGISSPLPPALRRLEFEGRVERLPEGGRLDTERYLWAAAAESPFADADLPHEPAALYARLGEIYFRAAGLATRRDFAAWAGVNQGEAKAVVQHLDLLPVVVEGVEETHYLPAALRDLPAAAVDAGEAVALLPFEDNLVALHGGPAALVEVAYHDTPVPVWGRGRGATLGDARHMSLRSVVAEGRIVGFWEYEPRDRAVVFGCFDTIAPATRSRLEAAAAELDAFLIRELGHGRSFSLDTDEALVRRARLIRGMKTADW